MNYNADTADKLIDLIYSSVLQTPRGESDRFELLQTVSRAKAQLLLTRYEVSGLILNNTLDAEQKATKQFNESEVARRPDARCRFSPSMPIICNGLGNTSSSNELNRPISFNERRTAIRFGSVPLP